MYFMKASKKKINPILKNQKKKKSKFRYLI